MFGQLFGRRAPQAPQTNGNVTETPVGSAVHVNVYDLWESNDSVYWCGVGIFHSGVEVYDSEYAYGAHDYTSSGIFETAPRKTPGTVGFRESVYVGHTTLSRQEVDEVCDKLGETYRGNQYHLLQRNCNHFTDSLALELTSNRSPGWVNRLARCGHCCACLLPAGLNPPLPPPPGEDLEDQPLLVDHIDVDSTTPNGDQLCPVPHPGVQRSHQPETMAMHR